MREIDEHPGDEELVRLNDAELVPTHERSLRRHLATCASCEARAAFVGRISTAAALARCETEVVLPGEHSRSRAALGARLEREAEAWPRSWPARVAAALSPTPRWVGLAGGIAALVLLMRWPAPQGPSDFEREALPVSSLTPGATAPLSAAALCAGTRAIQPISVAMRQQVLRDYGMTGVPEDQYELDYLITPELGGATDARNLWPQRYVPRPWNALVKDQLEDLLPKLVCRGDLALEAAQWDMARDWISAYKKYFKTAVPLRADSQEASPQGFRFWALGFGPRLAFGRAAWPHDSAVSCQPSARLVASFALRADS